MFTPEIITDLNPNEVFVFGTNQFAEHTSGAAKIAAEKFGALKGIAPAGLCQQSYGIITTSFSEIPVTIEFIKKQVEVLFEFAWLRPDLTFYVTKIGTGIAGFTIAEVVKVFRDLTHIKPSNIILPKEFTL